MRNLNFDSLPYRKRKNLKTLRLEILFLLITVFSSSDTFAFWFFFYKSHFSLPLTGEVLSEDSQSYTVMLGDGGVPLTSGEDECEKDGFPTIVFVTRYGWKNKCDWAWQIGFGPILGGNFRKQLLEETDKKPAFAIEVGGNGSFIDWARWAGYAYWIYTSGQTSKTLLKDKHGNSISILFNLESGYLLEEFSRDYLSGPYIQQQMNGLYFQLMSGIKMTLIMGGNPWNFYVILDKEFYPFSRNYAENMSWRKVYSTNLTLRSLFIEVIGSKHLKKVDSEKNK